MHAPGQFLFASSFLHIKVLQQGISPSSVAPLSISSCSALSLTALAYSEYEIVGSVFRSGTTGTAEGGTWALVTKDFVIQCDTCLACDVFGVMTLCFPEVSIFYLYGHIRNADIGIWVDFA